MKIISLGGGVQSSCLLLMANKGLIEADIAIFADPGNEKRRTLEYIEYLKSVSDIPIITVKIGNIMDDCLSAIENKKAMHTSPPFWFNGERKTGFLKQQCTAHYKIKAINRFVKNEYLKKIKFSQSSSITIKTGNESFEIKVSKIDSVEMLIGISMDEVHRMKPNRVKYIKNVFPLIERRLTRNMCIKWMNENGFIVPVKSGCKICPYQKTSDMKSLYQDERQEIAAFDNRLREGFGGKEKREFFVLSTRKPYSLYVKDINHPRLIDLGDDDFGGCDSGHCML